MKKKTKVLFIWKVRTALKKYLQDGLSHISNLELDFPDNIETVNLIQLGKDADVIVGWRPEEAMLRSSACRLFINPGAGVQHLIDLFNKLRSEREIILVNGHGNSYFTAQHALALLLALTNRIIDHHLWMKEGIWRTGDKEGASLPLRYRKVGLLGYGAVNSRLHEMLIPFESTVYVLRYDPGKGTEAPCAEIFGPEHLDRFLEMIDTVIVTVPFTRKTDNMINDRQLALLGSDGLLVNLSRGGVVNEKALYNALKEHIIRSAAIDVWYDYRPQSDQEGRKYPYTCPFHELDNVILSPHRAASPFSDLKRWDEVIENISLFCKGRENLLNIVDLDREY